MYADLCNVEQNIFSIIPHAVRVEASVSLRMMIVAGGSQIPQAAPFTKKSYECCLLVQITGCWQAMTQHWIQQ